MSERESGGGRQIAPIFTRKRPRQALFAYPSSSPLGATTVNYSGTSAVESPQVTRTYSHTGPTVYHPIPGPAFPARIPASTENPYQPPRRGRYGQPIAIPQQIQPPAIPTPPQFRTTGNFSTGPAHAAGPAVMRHRTCTMRYGGQPTQPSPCKAETAPAPKPQDSPVTKKHRPEETTNVSKPAAEVDSGTNYTRSRSPPDNSLRVLSSTIEGMNHWVQYRNRLPILFELMGVVSSAVTTHPGGGAKQFFLRDDKNTVNCIFYEIERTLPRVIRNHCYRCVGRVHLNGKDFQCLSIRPASDSERRLHKVAVRASDRAMRDWVTKKPEH